MVGDERSDEESPSRCRSPEYVSSRQCATTSPKIDSAGERSHGVLHDPSLPSNAFPQEVSTLVVPQESEF
jgi:hypothetical protein